MANKNFNTRIQLKSDTEANWDKATNFIPLEGEAIIYSADSTHPFSRLKVGDGVTVVSELPFVEGESQNSAITGVKGNSESDYRTGNVNITPANIGLGNVDNTSDLNKPISTATQEALNEKVNAVEGKGLSTEDYTSAEKTKLANIEANAQVNTITGVKGDSESEYRTGDINITKANIGLSNVDNTSDANKPISTATQTALNNKISTSLKGAASGVAELDENGKVPTSQLPSFVDDVVEYSSSSNFPLEGESGKIYVDTLDNKTYRWSGSGYVEISPSLALGETSSTAYRGDRGKTAYDHASAKGSAFSSGLYKITTNSEGHVTGATAVTKSDITALGIPGSDTNTNTTYTLTQDSSDGHKLTFAGSDGTSETFTIPDNNTTYTLSSLGIGNVKNYDQSKAIKSITRSGTTFTYTCLDNTTGTFTQQDNNTWTAMVGATSSANGTAGYVPAPPSSGYNTKYLRADGTWQVPPDNNTTYSNATASTAGLMSAADFKKINPVSIPADTDLNSLTNVGWYYCPSNSTVATFSNAPTARAFFLEVGRHAGTYQRLVEYSVTGAKHFHRNLNNGTWGDWVEWKLTDTVTSVKGNAESNYRMGNVNITAANIGLGNVNNTADANKSVSYASSAGSAGGVIDTDGTGNVKFDMGIVHTASNYPNAVFASSNGLRVANFAPSDKVATASAAGFMSAADKTKLNGIAAGAQVNSITGVKGNAESSYRTGNVNITAANIGAMAAKPAAIELTPSSSAGNGGYIDFHYNNSSADYTSRIIEVATGKIQINNSIVNSIVIIDSSLTYTDLYNELRYLAEGDTVGMYLGSAGMKLISNNKITVGACGTITKINSNTYVFVGSAVGADQKAMYKCRFSVTSSAITPVSSFSLTMTQL